LLSVALAITAYRCAWNSFNIATSVASQMKRILFLCTGNYYRSRYAEIFFNAQAIGRGLPWRAESRGLALDPYNVGPISRHTKSKLIELGMWSDDYGRHPMPASEDDFAAADLIIAVKEAEHRPLMEVLFPQWRDAIEYWHVHDLDCSGPDEAICHLEREILGLLDRLTASTNAGDQANRSQTTTT
jgi:protein-tyrosine phosphatase